MMKGFIIGFALALALVAGIAVAAEESSVFTLGPGSEITCSQPECGQVMVGPIVGGDANCDFTANRLDALIILRNSVGLPSTPAWCKHIQDDAHIVLYVPPGILY